MNKKLLIKLLFLLPLLLTIGTVNGYILLTATLPYSGGGSVSCDYGFLGSCSRSLYALPETQSVSFFAISSTLDYFYINLHFYNGQISSDFSHNGEAHITYDLVVYLDGTSSAYKTFPTVTGYIPDDLWTLPPFINANYFVDAGPGLYTVYITFNLWIDVSGSGFLPGTATGAASVDFDLDLTIDARDQSRGCGPFSKAPSIDSSIDYC